MGSHAHAGAVHATGSTGGANPSAPAFSSLMQVATVELLSTLQLLAERARFLTGADGVAIALEENGRFVYRAGAGSSVETGTNVDKSKAPIAKCLATAKMSIVSAHTAQTQTVKAAIPITQHGEVLGFFELYASRANFPDDDLRAVSSLAEMVVTALDHMRAAEGAHKQIVENASANTPEPVAPLSWHAEATTEPAAKQDASAVSTSAPLNVQVCHSCGFPVSEGRYLCVECEQKPDAPRLPNPQLLVNQNDPSWIETHGYTLASLLITAVVIAIIYWLR
jgi:GAF domain